MHTNLPRALIEEKHQYRAVRINNSVLDLILNLYKLGRYFLKQRR